MAPPHLQAVSNMTHKRSHLDAFQRSGLQDQAPNSIPAGPPAKRKQKAQGAANTYTVQVQRVSVKKKKTTYLDSYETTAPEGYTYFPVGFRRIKDICRDECLRQNKLYYVVSLFPKTNAVDKFSKMTITRNIYRFGWHFPNEIVFAVVQNLKLLTPEQIYASRNPLALQTKAGPDILTDYNIADLVKDLFPNIPDDDLDHVVRHAFKSGTDRIGNADDVAFARKIQLAVLAGIRHVHTDYDALLKSKMPRQVARMTIEPKCLRVLLKWRGEDDEVDIEERTEEVIVIEDSEDESSDELDAYNYSAGQSKLSPELKIVSWRHKGREIHNEDLPADYFNPSFLSVQQRGPAQHVQSPRKRQPTIPQGSGHRQRAQTPVRRASKRIAVQKQYAERHRREEEDAERERARHREVVAQYGLREHPPAANVVPPYHEPVASHEEQPVAFRPRPSMPQPPSSALQIVYDKAGKPFYLQPSDRTVASPPELPLNRVITPDTALPSIEPETRPPAPFIFTGDSRLHAPFDFHPSRPAPQIPFRPYHDVGHDPRHPVDLDKSPRSNYPQRPNRQFIDLASSEERSERPRHHIPSQKTEPLAHAQHRQPPSPRNWQQSQDKRSLHGDPLPPPHHVQQGFGNQPYLHPPSNVSFKPFAPSQPPPPPRYY